MAETALLDSKAIHLAETAATKDIAIRLCGQALVDAGAVEPGYIQAMLEREQTLSTYLGEGVAIPHGTNASKTAVRRDALAFLRFPDGVDWDGERVTVCIAIAALGDGHIAILSELAQVLSDPEKAAALREADTEETVLRLLRPEEGAE